MDDAPPTRRRWQFNLAGVFVVVTVIGALLGFLRWVPEVREIAGWKLLVALVAAAAIAIGLNAEYRIAGNGRVGLARSLLHIGLCLYVPFGWLMLMDYPWSDYHLGWLKLWPLLPGFVPGAVLFHPHDLPEFLTMGLTTATLLFGLGWFGARGRKSLLAAAGIALLVSVPTAFITYGLYWF